MILNFNIKNIIASKIGDICEAYLYYSSDYDDFTILIISHCDDVDRIYCYKTVDNLYSSSKQYAVDLFFKECSNVVFNSEEIKQL